MDLEEKWNFASTDSVFKNASLDWKLQYMHFLNNLNDYCNLMLRATYERDESFWHESLIWLDPKIKKRHSILVSQKMDMIRSKIEICLTNICTSLGRLCGLLEQQKNGAAHPTNQTILLERKDLVTEWGQKCILARKSIVRLDAFRQKNENNVSAMFDVSIVESILKPLRLRQQ